MRLSGRRERQRRNLPCRVIPAECCQERRESLSIPCHYLSICRQLWFGPMRSSPQQGVVQRPIEYCSDKSATFACYFPPIVFVNRSLLFCRPWGIASGYCASPLVGGDCFSATAALAASCSVFDGNTCMPESSPSTQTWLRNSVSPYLLKVTSLLA